MSIISTLTSNPVFVGLAGSMAMGSVLYVLRTAPKLFGDALWMAITVRVRISSDDPAFEAISEWLIEHGYSKRARVLNLTTRPGEAQEWGLAPGYGNHWIWENGPVRIERMTDEKQSSSSYRLRETFIITTLGRSQGKVRDLIERANQQRHLQDSLVVRIWKNSYWSVVPGRVRRRIDTVMMPDAQKRDVVDDATWFFSSRDWYESRGVPYRRGYLLHGAPGTGKSSLVLALASHFGRPIFVLNLASVRCDDQLIDAFTSASSNCILLIEDVDCAGVTGERAPPMRAIGGEKPGPNDDARGVTLSGLLNAIDGVASAEGRLLVMTTNHRDKLDAALLRSARVDREFELQALTIELVLEMGRRFGLVSTAWQIARLRDTYRSNSERPAAWWQGYFLQLAAADTRLQLASR